MTSAPLRLAPETPAPRVRRSGVRGPGAGRRVARLLSVAAFVGFTALVFVRLREGFEKRSGDPTRAATSVPEEPEEVVSRAIEFTQFDERGRPFFQVRADEAVGPSDGAQRFLGVEVRLLRVYGDRDALVAADELLLDARSESLEFLGNALLSLDGLELAGPRLVFRRGPDRLWFPDPVQFVSDDFVGVAASLRFQVDLGKVTLTGVVAEPTEPDGFSVVAGRASFDRNTEVTSLFGEVEIASERFALTSRRTVTAHREAGRMRSLEAGFGSALRITDPDAAEVTLRGSDLEIELDDGRIPRVVRVLDRPVLRDGSVELRGQRARLDLDAAGRPERFRISGEVTSRLEVEGAGSRVRIRAQEMEMDFDDGDGQQAGASYRGAVEARYGRARATAEVADWNGEDTLQLGGAPRITDSSLAELEAEEVRLVVGEASRIEAEGSVTARFLPDRLGWLPGDFAGAGLSARSATLVSGAGRGAFGGGVRLLFGRNRLSAEALEVDAGAGTLHATGGVATSLEFEPAASGGAPGDSGASGPPAPRTVVFDAASERFSWERGAARLAYEGAPRLEQQPEPGEPRLVTAGRIEAELLDSGEIEAVVGLRSARFERGSDRVRGSRIRFEPGADRLEAWGSPAVLEVGGRLSRGGYLDLAFDEDRSEIASTRARRAVTTVRIEADSVGARRAGVRRRPR